MIQHVLISISLPGGGETGGQAGGPGRSPRDPFKGTGEAAERGEAIVVSHTKLDMLQLPTIINYAAFFFF